MSPEKGPFLKGHFIFQPINLGGHANWWFQIFFIFTSTWENDPI